MSPNIEWSEPEIWQTRVAVEDLQQMFDTTLTFPEPEDVLSIESGIIDSLNEDLSLSPNSNVSSLEQTLRDLLVQVTSTDNLESVSQLRLRVLSRETSLQQLHLHTPALRELILDGSVISSLRDLGCSLKNLRVLSINRCGLTNLDGIFSLHSLQHLHAQDNAITDSGLFPCSLLTQINTIDLRRNCIQWLECVSFLAVCVELEQLHLQGNPAAISTNYRQFIISSLPSLKSLDGEHFDRESFAGTVAFTEACDTSASAADSEQAVAKTESEQVSSLGDQRNKLLINPSNKTVSRQQMCETYHARGLRLMSPSRMEPFTTSFPPKVISPRNTSTITMSSDTENHCSRKRLDKLKPTEHSNEL